MKKILALLLIIILGIFVVQKGNLLNRPAPIVNLPTPTSTPTPTPGLKSEVHSPDGTMKIIMQIKKSTGSTTYSFFVAEISGKNQKFIFTRTLTPESTMSIPQNSFSPDNKYVYLEEDQGILQNALVFKTSGETFTKDEQYRDTAAILSQSKPGYSLKNATGWASPTLLQTYLQKEDAKSSSYWFVPETKAFIGPVI